MLKIFTPKPEFTTKQFFQLLYSRPFFIMIGLIMFEAVFSATVTYFVIQAGKDIANNDFKLVDFVWIVAAQGGSYVLHGISWVFGERAGFAAYAHYMAQFTRDNRQHASLLGDKPTREQVEPFLTNETFHLLFELMYELEAALSLFFTLILNALVIGHEIDAGFPLAYALIFVLIMLLQYCVRKPVAAAYLNNQAQTNRMTAQTYTAWDNIYAGNLYNFRIWQREFKTRLITALRAQIKAILLRETLSSISGIMGLIVVFTVMAWVVYQDTSNLPVLVALAATLPKQIDMTHQVHGLAIGLNDLVALWVRAHGISSNMHPDPVANLPQRLSFSKLELRAGGITAQCESLTDVMVLLNASNTGRINVRGENGAGKSTLLLALREQLQGAAYYWPTADRLAYRFAAGVDEDAQEWDGDDAEGANPPHKTSFSSGETQLRALTEIVENTRAQVYLLDEWDANLDAHNRAKAWALIERLAQRARVVEISHRDAIPTQ